MPHAIDHQTSTAPWTRLWRTGVLHSCTSGIDGNYDDAFAHFWQQQFRHLHDHATLVDVGTGNGAIPLLALSIAGTWDQHWQLHGVDSADINPRNDGGATALQYRDIRFHPNTSMTELPFAKGSVDLVCSQFAFEYAPREQAAREILRVIGQHGRAALVMHSDDSVVHTVSLSQSDACAWLLHESRIFDAARKLLRHLAGANSPEKRRQLSLDPQAESARNDFNDAASRLMARVERAPDARVLQTLAQELGSMLQRFWSSPDEADAAMTSLHAWARDEHARLGLMLGATLSRPELQNVVESFGATGLPTRIGKLMYKDTTPMGWTLVVGHE